MVIRQSPIHQTAFDPEPAHLCARLAREIIRSHDAFTKRYPKARASGYFITASLVECIYHLAPVLHYSTNVEEHNTSVAALKQAYGILVLLSSKLNVSKRALRAINGVMLKWGSEGKSRNIRGRHPGDAHVGASHGRVSCLPSHDLRVVTFSCQPNELCERNVK